MEKTLFEQDGESKVGNSEGVDRYMVSSVLKDRQEVGVCC